jgi:hypothetical protein
MGVSRNESSRSSPADGTHLGGDDGQVHRRIPLEQVGAAFSSMELENMELLGKWQICTCSRLVVYNQQARELGGRRTMAV